MIWLILGLIPVVGFVCWVIYKCIIDRESRIATLFTIGIMAAVALPSWAIVYGLYQLGVE